MAFTDAQLEKLKERQKNPFVSLNREGINIDQLIVRLEAAESFILESRNQNLCNCDRECEKHLPLEKAWLKSKGEPVE